MAAKFETASKDTMAKALGILAAHHRDLHAAGVSIEILFAYAPENSAGEKTGPAIKASGYACIGTAKIVPLIQRVLGCADARITLDGDRWDSLHPEQQEAILDHELQHLSVAKDVEGALILDTHGRPKLKMRLHDRQFGWFDVVAKRHREASQEVLQAVQLYEQAAQCYFPFLGLAALPADPDAPEIEAPKKPAPKKKGSGRRGMIK